MEEGEVMLGYFVVGCFISGLGVFVWFFFLGFSVGMGGIWVIERGYLVNRFMEGYFVNRFIEVNFGVVLV